LIDPDPPVAGITQGQCLSEMRNGLKGDHATCRADQAEKLSEVVALIGAHIEHRIARRDNSVVSAGKIGLEFEHGTTPTRLAATLLGASLAA